MKERNMRKDYFKAFDFSNWRNDRDAPGRDGRMELGRGDSRDNIRSSLLSNVCLRCLLTDGKAECVGPGAGRTVGEVTESVMPSSDSYHFLGTVRSRSLAGCRGRGASVRSLKRDNKV